MKVGAKVALSIMDPDNSDRYVQLRGTVTRVREDEVAAAHIDSLAHKYLGVDKNPYAKADDVRVMFEITVFSVQGMSQRTCARRSMEARLTGSLINRFAHGHRWHLHQEKPYKDQAPPPEPMLEGCSGMEAQP